MQSRPLSVRANLHYCLTYSNLIWRRTCTELYLNAPIYNGGTVSFFITLHHTSLLFYIFDPQLNSTGSFLQTYVHNRRSLSAVHYSAVELSVGICRKLYFNEKRMERRRSESQRREQAESQWNWSTTFPRLNLNDLHLRRVSLAQEPRSFKCLLAGVWSWRSSYRLDHLGISLSVCSSSMITSTDGVGALLLSFLTASL